jgi:hypothetical protein
MRLLNIKTFQLETFYSDVPDYAALSHTWGNEEVTFQDLTADVGRTKKGWNKILGSIVQVAKHNCNYVWIDTCCIDKTSSAELSEAINSMFRWYRKSKVCFAYLEDVSAEPGWKEDQVEVGVVFDAAAALGDEEETPPPLPLPAICFLPRSRWFKRGWTLQELIAPKAVHFYDSSWNEIGEKRQLEKEIFKITGIDSDVLHNYEALYTKSIARRMSWASYRETTKTEDIAYCLMGIFNINMPLLYGEGERAFIRLQEAIMRLTYDHSLFAWNHHFPNTLYGTSAMLQDGPLLGVGLLAPHPSAFETSANITPHTIRTEPYEITNRGLRMYLRLLEHSSSTVPHTHFAILQFGYTNNLGTAIAIPIAQISASKFSSPEDEFYRSTNLDFIEIEYSQATPLKHQHIYFLTAGPLSKVSDAFYRCWLRNYGQELGIRFHKARYCQYPTKTMDSDNTSCLWNYESKSMTWAKSWRGSRAALYFSKKDGPAFVVLLTFASLSDQGGQIGIDVHIKSVTDCTKGAERESPRQVVLDQVLVKDFHHGQVFGLTEAQKTLHFENQLMTIRVKKEMVFDEDMFIIDFSFSGVKRGNSETTPESRQKRSKQNKTTFKGNDCL